MLPLRPQKHLAKGRDLHEATLNVEPLRGSASDLEHTLHAFSKQLEAARERVEGASRLHHLLGQQLKEDEAVQEIQRLAEKIGRPDLLERAKQTTAVPAAAASTATMGSVQSRATAALKIDVKRLFSTSTPERPTNLQPRLQVKSVPSKTQSPVTPDGNPSWMIGSSATRTVDQYEEIPMCKVTRQCASGANSESQIVTPQSPQGDQETSFGLRSPLNEREALEEDEEDHSKMADSGLGGCDRCEGQESSKLKRACSCQSFEDAAMMIKSNDSDLDEEDEDDGCFRRGSKERDHEMMSFQANSHLFNHSSNLNLDSDVPGLDQKTQK